MSSFSLAGAKSSTNGGGKKFLSGRPSLHDIITIAPEWESTFKSVHDNLAERDAQRNILRATICDLRAKNDECKISVFEKLEIARADTAAQNSLLIDIEEQQPQVRKLRRQVNAVSAACQRAMAATSGQGTSSITGAMIVVPQPDNMQFVEELRKRSVELEQRAEAVLNSIAALKRDIQDGSVNLESELRTVLSLFMAQYKQLKFSQLGLREELKAAIQSYRGVVGNIDQQLEDAVADITDTNLTEAIF